MAWYEASPIDVSYVVYDSVTAMKLGARLRVSLLLAAVTEAR